MLLYSIMLGGWGGEEGEQSIVRHHSKQQSPFFVWFPLILNQ